ncbi:RNA-directed DNA polymerase-like protein [Plakobranchus ocellatus]|uniref:RNA-directed DNA polymerase-like protein n=1 Tax=Plakobranchus ocellatus TaxID=259542 RepID=A0AAV4BUU1_9GAST|nr:RNA-directed DNA polymerase-like protein [Plakobranchus ocellatus]
MYRDTCQALGLLKAVNKLQKEDITDEFSDVFSGLGKLQDHKVKLHIDEPVAQKYRRIPFHIRKQLDKHLDEEEEMGVIEKATGPTPWELVCERARRKLWKNARNTRFHNGYCAHCKRQQH